MTVRFKETTVQILQGDVPFSGVRLCYECGAIDQMDVEQVPYEQKVLCKCGHGKSRMTPLSDKEVMYYLSQHMKVKTKLREFYSLLHGIV